MEAKFEIYPSGNQYRWRLKSANGDVVASGESYTSKNGAHTGVQTVKHAAAEATIEDADR